MPTKKEYLDFVLEWLSPLVEISAGEITGRSMMGGYVLYCGGAVFALIAENTLYLKADDATRPRFQALGLKPFQPFPDQPSGKTSGKTSGKSGTMGYYPPPAEFFEDPEVMADWGAAAVETGRRAQAKRKPKGTAKRKAKSKPRSK